MYRLATKIQILPIKIMGCFPVSDSCSQSPSHVNVSPSTRRSPRKSPSPKRWFEGRGLITINDVAENSTGNIHHPELDRIIKTNLKIPNEKLQASENFYYLSILYFFIFL